MEMCCDWKHEITQVRPKGHSVKFEWELPVCREKHYVWSGLYKGACWWHCFCFLSCKHRTPQVFEDLLKVIQQVSTNRGLRTSARQRTTRDWDNMNPHNVMKLWENRWERRRDQIRDNETRRVRLKATKVKEEVTKQKTDSHMQIWHGKTERQPRRPDWGKRVGSQKRTNKP